MCVVLRRKDDYPQTRHFSDLLRSTIQKKKKKKKKKNIHQNEACICGCTPYRVGSSA
jgi:hypothetical protein